MASTLSYTYTGKYSSSTRSITAWIRYTFEPDYSQTQARLRIHSMGVRNNSGSDMLWGTSSTNGPKYMSATPTGQSQYKIDRTSTSFNWDNNYDYWNFCTNGRNAAITAWDGNTVATYYYTKGTVAQTKYLVGHVYKKGAWAVNADFSVALTVPAQTFTVSFNANGGSGAPVSQKKTYNVALTLTATSPTREGYDFLGWGTSAGDSLPTYRYGNNHEVATSFTTDADTILYAVWHAKFTPPKIEALRAYRVASGASGANPSAYSSGTKGYADFTYTAPSNYNTVSVAIIFNSTSVSPSTSGTTKYAYASATIPLSSAINVTAKVTGTTYTYTVNGTTYGGESFTVAEDTFISKEAYIWDAYKNAGGYQSFAVGQIARESSSEYDNTEPTAVSGDMDVFFRATFINDTFIYINQNAGAGTVDNTILKALEDLGWASDVIDNYHGS